MPNYGLLQNLPQVQAPNLVGGFLSGLQSAQEGNLRLQQGEVAKANLALQQKQLEFLPEEQRIRLEQADQAKQMNALNMQSTQLGMQQTKQQMQNTAQDRQRLLATDINEKTASLKLVPQSQRSIIYNAFLKDLKAQGQDISKYPKTYGKEAEALVEEAHYTSGQYLKQLQAQANQPLEKVMTPDGPKLVPRNQAAGMAPYDPKAPIPLPAGNVALTSAAQSKTQDEVIGYDSTLNTINKLEENYSPDYFGYKARARAESAEQADKIGRPTDNDYLAKRTEYRNEVKQLFNQYRKEITGAAASEKELKDLEQSMMNMDQSPVQFTASLNQLKSKIAQARESKAKLLREGISTRSEQPKKSENKEKTSNLQSGQIIMGKDGKRYQKVEGGYAAI